MTAPRLTIGTKYRIDGLRDAGTGTSDYDRWRFLGLRNGWATFDGSTPDPVFVRPDDLTRVGRQHLVMGVAA